MKRLKPINSSLSEKRFKNHRTYANLFLSLLLLIAVNAGYAQSEATYVLGKEESFSKQLLVPQKSSTIPFQLSKTENVAISVHLREGDFTQYEIMGSIQNVKNSSFYISKQNKEVSGRLIFKDKNESYKIFTNDLGEVAIKKVDIDSLICTDIQKADSGDAGYDNSKSAYIVPELQSLPGSDFTIYLDFDGERVTNTQWANGGTIDAESNNYNDNTIRGIWQIMAEDFAPFNINVTTNRAVYDATPVKQRIMTIFTTTTTAAPGSGGVAYINSFSSSSDEPCWVFNRGVRAAGETGSHEVGHTLGLAHDGVPGTTYYAGHGEWSPIMGWSVNKPIGHWSKGEYDNANQTQDDIAIITNNRNAFGFKPDDVGDTLNEAKEIAVNSDGTVEADKNEGLITTRNDKDVYKFITAGGEVNFDLQPNPNHPNLNIQARLLSATGEELEISNPNKDLSARINTNLAGGTYFIEIDGKGEGNLSNGYSDYSSIGVYSISGSYAPGDNNQPPVANFEASQDCSAFTFTSTSINLVKSFVWDFGDGNTSTEEKPTHTYTQSGTYTVKLTVTNDNGSDEIIKDNFAQVVIASTPEDTSAAICSGEPAVVDLSGSNGYIWYDSPDGNTVVATGSTVEFPDITGTTTFYVSGTSKPVLSGTVGLKDINPNAGKIHQGGWYLVFDTKEETILKKARVLAEGAGARTLQLLNAEGNLVESKNINIPDGESVIDINLTIPEGNDWQIGFAETANLFRTNDNNLGYPFEIADVVTIKRSTADDGQALNYYYYLYDWEVATTGECESSERAKVTITVGEKPNKPQVTTNQDLNQFTVDNQYSRYQWYLNDEIITEATNQTYTAIEAGVYKVEVFNDAGCSEFSDPLELSTLSVVNFDRFDAIRLYPNPVNERLYISGLEGIREINSIKIVNMLGQVVQSHFGKVSEFDMTSLRDGVYFLTIDNKKVHKIIKSTR